MLGHVQIHCANVVFSRECPHHQVVDLADDLDGNEAGHNVENFVSLRADHNVRNEAAGATQELEKGEHHRVMEALIREGHRILLGEAHHFLGRRHLWQNSDV